MYFFKKQRVRMWSCGGSVVNIMQTIERGSSNSLSDMTFAAVVNNSMVTGSSTDHTMSFLHFRIVGSVVLVNDIVNKTYSSLTRLKSHQLLLHTIV